MEDIKEFGEYTHWPQRKSFQEERDMVKMVVENDEENTIREYLKPLVRHWIEDYKTKQPQIKLTDDEFLEAGFMYLELGLKKYYEKLEKGKVGFKFSTYF